MNAKDFIQVLEYMKTFAPKEKKQRRSKKDFNDNDVDIVAFIQKERRRLNEYNDFLEELAKINKKEDKKDDKKEGKGDLLKLAFFFYAISPFTGMLFVWMFKHLVG